MRDRKRALRVRQVVIALWVVAAVGGWPKTVIPSESDPEPPELVGSLTRSEIEEALPDWVEHEVEATPDLAAAAELPAALSGSEVTVYLGTWCSDSRRELTRLWRALDEAGAVSPSEIRYIGVDRDKHQPAEWLAGADLLYVPTFVVHRHGREVGRIVETAPEGIEHDLLALLRGDKEGVVTAREDLGSEAAPEPR